MEKLRDRLAQNEFQRQQAKENNNYALLIGLFCVGCALMTQYIACSAHYSLKEFFMRLKGNIAREEVRELGPHVLKDDDQQR